MAPDLIFDIRDWRGLGWGAGVDITAVTPGEFYKLIMLQDHFRITAQITVGVECDVNNDPKYFL